MDRHDGVALTPAELEVAHTRDLEAQARYDVQYHTVWYDAVAGTVFCLMEVRARKRSTRCTEKRTPCRRA